MSEIILLVLRVLYTFLLDLWPLLFCLLGSVLWGGEASGEEREHLLRPRPPPPAAQLHSNCFLPCFREASCSLSRVAVPCVHFPSTKISSCSCADSGPRSPAGSWSRLCRGCRPARPMSCRLACSIGVADGLTVRRCVWGVRLGSSGCGGRPSTGARVIKGWWAFWVPGVSSPGSQRAAEVSLNPRGGPRSLSAAAVSCLLCSAAHQAAGHRGNTGNSECPGLGTSKLYVVGSNTGCSLVRWAPNERPRRSGRCYGVLPGPWAPNEPILHGGK